MTAKRLALYTFGVFRAPADDPVNAGFHTRNDRNFQAAELSDGFIARWGYDGEPGPASWGEQVYPRFYVERGDLWSPSTLSLWRDLTSAMAFSYGTTHAEAMRHAREWFDKPAWPAYVLWWVDLDCRPNWFEAVSRHEYLHDHGASEHAFDFKTPFDADGRPVHIDKAAIRRAMRLNEARRQPPR